MIRILRTILKIDSQPGKNASQTAMRTRLIRALQCIPEMTSLKEEDAKWKINIKHEPTCALHIKSERKIKKDPGCPVHTKSDVKISNEPGCPVHTKSDVKIKKEPGCPVHTKSDVKIKKEPGCSVHTKSDVKIKKEPGCPLHIKSEIKTKEEPGSGNEKLLKHDSRYTPAHDLSDDGDVDVDLPEKIVKTEPDDSDGKTDEKCESEEKVVKKGEKVYVMIM